MGPSRNDARDKKRSLGFSPGNLRTPPPQKHCVFPPKEVPLTLPFDFCPSRHSCSAPSLKNTENSKGDEKFVPHPSQHLSPTPLHPTANPKNTAFSTHKPSLPLQKLTCNHPVILAGKWPNVTQPAPRPATFHHHRRQTPEHPLAIPRTSRYTSARQNSANSGRSSAWLERLLWEQEVARSNRVAPIRLTAIRE